jgi:hypothetical protein
MQQSVQDRPAKDPVGGQPVKLGQPESLLLGGFVCGINVRELLLVPNNFVFQGLDFLFAVANLAVKHPAPEQNQPQKGSSHEARDPNRISPACLGLLFVHSK